MQILKTASLNLIDSTKNHYKFYHLSLLETNCVAIRYGRIGTVGQSLQHQYDTRADAEAKFASLLRAKLRKGYQQTKTTVAKTDIQTTPPIAKAILEEFPNLF
ncbi:MAG: WGR domain-containing protein [Waterburya sp.]